MAEPTGLLLDTHVLLWLYLGKAQLGSTARTAIERSDVVAVSVASLMEIAIKSSLGKLDVHVAGIGANVERDRLLRLDLRDSHLAALNDLEWPAAGHRDPFDRMLVCQAKTEGLTLVTADTALADYDVPIMNARA